MRILLLVTMMALATACCAQVGPGAGPSRPPTSVTDYPAGFQSIYPRAFMYNEILSTGAPFRTGAKLWTTNLEAIAKWDVVTFDVVGNRASASAGDNRPVINYIRGTNPTIKLLAFSAGQVIFKCTDGWWWDAGDVGWSWNGAGFPGGNCDTAGTDFSWARTRAIRQNNAMVYSKTRDRNNDGKKDAFVELQANGTATCCAEPRNPLYVDFAMPGIAQALADTISGWAKELSGGFDGIFVDQMCNSIAFLSDGANEDSVDYTRSGNGSLVAWDNAYKAGAASFWARLRSQTPANWLLVGNGCNVGDRTSANGWMRENFPNQAGGTWASNMLGSGAADVGYLGDDSLYVTPSSSVLLRQRQTSGGSFDVNLAQDNLGAQQQHRWVIGSATLGDGMGGITGTIFDGMRGYLPWWADEFAVTPDGRSTLDRKYKGWLGAPLGKRFPVGAGWRRDFKGGTVLVNPTGSPVAFTLEAGIYFRLTGVVCPTVNTGAAAGTSITVPATDAIFLQRRPQLK